MSMIDTSDKTLNKSPFNDLKDLDNIPENPFEGVGLDQAREVSRFSTRSCIFTAFIMISLSFMLPVYAGRWSIQQLLFYRAEYGKGLGSDGKDAVII